MEGIEERIRKLRKALHFTQAEFADLFGVTSAHISAIEKGTNIPSKMLVMFICEKLGVSEEWLQTGKGNVRSKEKYLKVLERENGKIAFEAKGTYAEAVCFVSAAIIYIAEGISKETGLPYDTVEKDVISKVIEMT